MRSFLAPKVCFLLYLICSCGSNDKTPGDNKVSLSFTRVNKDNSSYFSASKDENHFALTFSKKAVFSLSDSYSSDEPIKNMHSFQFCSSSKIEPPKCSVITTNCCNQESSFSLDLVKDPKNEKCFLVEDFAKNVNVKKLHLKFETDAYDLVFSE